MAKLREGNLDETVKAIVDTIMSESYLDRKSLTAKLRPVIGSLVKDADRPKNYDNIKTDKGRLVRTIEQKDLERDFWKHALKKDLKMRKKVKVVMLPTEKAGMGLIAKSCAKDNSLFIMNHTDKREKGFWDESGNNYAERGQHLYLVSDEEIKEGDCVVHRGTALGTGAFPTKRVIGFVTAVLGERVRTTCINNVLYTKQDYLKVIATTNPELTK